MATIRIMTEGPDWLEYSWSSGTLRYNVSVTEPHPKAQEDLEHLTDYVPTRQLHVPGGTQRMALLVIHRDLAQREGETRLKPGDRVVFRASPTNPQVRTAYIGTIAAVESETGTDLAAVEVEGYGPGHVSKVRLDQLRPARPGETPQSVYRCGF
tara:strand:+ start:4606 stop:5067 length:462 start_codon:yes stop_codon:yes gene_type:complete